MPPRRPRPNTAAVELEDARYGLLGAEGCPRGRTYSHAELVALGLRANERAPWVMLLVGESTLATLGTLSVVVERTA